MKMERHLNLVYLISELLVILISQADIVHCSKLNLPRVLLPLFNDFSTNFTLEAFEGGCFKW